MRPVSEVDATAANTRTDGDIDAVASALNRTFRGWLADGTLLVALAMALSTALLLRGLLRVGAVTRFPLEAGQAIDLVQHGALDGRFLIQLLAAGLGGLSVDIAHVTTVLIALCAMAAGTQLLVAYGVARAELGGMLASTHLAAPVLLVSIAGLGLAASLPKRSSMYLGQFPPNAWHASIVALATPLALALLWQTVRYLGLPRRRALVHMMVLASLLVGIEPGLVLAWAIALVPLLLGTYGVSRPSLAALAAGIVPVVLLVGVELTASTPVGLLREMRFAPFEAWRAASPGIPASFIASFAFPLVALATFPRALVRSPTWRCAAALLITAFALLVLLGDTSPAEPDLSWGWSVMTATWLVCFATITAIARELAVGSIQPWRTWLAFLVFAAHVASGPLYLGAFFASRTYLA